MSLMALTVMVNLGRCKGKLFGLTSVLVNLVYKCMLTLYFKVISFSTLSGTN